MKYITLLLLGVIQARFNSETEDALLDFDEGTENDIDEQNGLPYTNKAIKDAYLLQVDQTMTSGVNNSILLEAQDRLKNRHKFGEGCSLGETLHTGTGLDLDEGEEMVDDN